MITIHGLIGIVLTRCPVRTSPEALSALTHLLHSTTENQKGSELRHLLPQPGVRRDQNSPATNATQIGEDGVD